MSTKIDRQICDEGKVVAASRGITVAEYFSEILRPIVQRDRWALGEDLLRDRPQGDKPGGDKPDSGDPGLPEGGPPGKPGKSGPRLINPDRGPSEPTGAGGTAKSRKRGRTEDGRRPGR